MHSNYLISSSFLVCENLSPTFNCTKYMPDGTDLPSLSLQSQYTDFTDLL